MSLICRFFLAALIVKSFASFCQTISYYPDSIIVGQDTGCGIIRYVPVMQCDPPVDPWQGGSRSCRIDLDGDGVIDITSYYSMSSVAMQGASYHSSGLSTRDSCFICVQPANHGLADSIKVGDLIDSSRTWGRSVDLGSSYWSMNGSSSSSGYQPNYYGIKIKNGNVITYGWYGSGVYVVAAICTINLQDTTQHPDTTTHHLQDTTHHHVQNSDPLNVLRCYPNPANEELTIEADSSAQVQVILTDVTGRQVINTTITDKKGIDTKTLDYGVYYVELKTTYKSLKQKLAIYH